MKCAVHPWQFPVPVNSKVFFIQYSIYWCIVCTFLPKLVSKFEVRNPLFLEAYFFYPSPPPFSSLALVPTSRVNFSTLHNLSQWWNQRWPPCDYENKQAAFACQKNTCNAGYDVLRVFFNTGENKQGNPSLQKKNKLQQRKFSS